MSSKKPVVLFHKSCADGVTAAYSIYQKFGENAHYIPMIHSEEKEEFFQQLIDEKVIDGNEIYVVDFYINQNTVKFLKPHVSNITILDHHMSAVVDYLKTFSPIMAKVLIDNLPDDKKKIDFFLASRYEFKHDKFTFIFDNTHSGASLTYKHFNPQTSFDNLPPHIKYVEDVDLWKHKYEDSKAFVLGLGSVSKSFDYKEYFKYFDNKEKSYEEKMDEIINIGKEYVKIEKEIVEEKIKTAVEYEFFNKKLNRNDKVLVLFIDESLNKYKSELGNKLAIKNTETNKALIISVLPNGIVKCAGRSIGEANINEIAEQFGGGGHKNASGFKFKNILEFNENFKKIKNSQTKKLTA